MTPSRFGLAVFVAACSCFAPLAAQDDPHASCAAMGWVPAEILE
jgi:hypothetical protein